MAVDPAAIEPGSTAYGDRQTLEQGLSEVGGGANPGAGAPQAPTSVVAPDDPLTAMLGGGISSPNAPLTSGLSVGPGPGPDSAPTSPLDSDLGQKLKMIANQTTSPTLRRLAVARLRRMYRGVDNG